MAADPNHHSAVTAVETQVLHGRCSKLCKKCSVLAFDDTELAYEENGLRVSALIFLEFEHLDTLPDLPLLQESAVAGCLFCAALRNATLDLGIHRTTRVSFKLWYEGLDDGSTFYSVEKLVAAVKILGVADNLDESHLLGFSVDSDGKVSSTMQ